MVSFPQVSPAKTCEWGGGSGRNSRRKDERESNFFITIFPDVRIALSSGLKFKFRRISAY